MASYALASLKQTIILEFVHPNSRMSLDDDESLISLYQKLSSMQAFLSKKSEGGGAIIRDLEIEIRDFALKTEDGIEMQLSNIFQLDKDSVIVEEACGKLHQNLQEAAEDAEKLLMIINDTSNETEGAGDTHSSIHSLGGSFRLSPEPEEIMIFCQHRRLIDRIEDLLLCADPRRKVIPVFGMAGIGKTTFARRLYGDPLIAANFEIKAWVTMSHEYDLQQILCDLLQSMMPTVIINEGSTPFQLKEQLYKHLKDRRYFIVLDDVWKTQDYNDIQQCFPNDPCGSCIFLTTMFEEVAANSYSHCAYRMGLLNEDESWDLFSNRFSLKGYMTPKFKKIAKHVVKQCEGLPRSIVTVAERLSKCNTTLKEWKKVKKEIDALGALYKDAQYSRKLTLIYNQLPQQLKICFLYFAVFPKGSSIQVKKLLKLWIAEGFLEPFEHRTSKDYIAYRYLLMLVDRSLVLAINYDFDYEIKTCWMQGALHSFCVREAQKEGLFCAVKTQPSLGWSLSELKNSFRWLSLRSHSLDYYVFFSSNIPRSVFFFHGDPEAFVPFMLLRTLEFSPSLILQSVPLGLGDLVFLRYLSVPKWFEGLDDVVASNQNLQTLMVSGVKSELGPHAHHLSSRIWELPQLCHLELGNMYTIDPPSTDKEHLETLSWVNPTNFRKGMHCKFPNLRNLKISYKDVFELSGTRASCRNLIIILENIMYLSRLETLKITVPVGSITLVERLVFPTQLKKLSLKMTNLPMNVLRAISQLPYLESLKLRSAFYGKVWEVVEGEFPKLRNLFLEARNLERWVANSNHFPYLENLILRRCYCLEEIPRDFVEIRGLWSIRLVQCPPSVFTSAKWIHEEAKDKKDRRIVVDLDGVVQYM